jgi:DUF2971 family protein
MVSFRRYTNLAATIHLLRNKSITLLNPATWDDRNDAYFMAEYKRYSGANTVLAVCFAEQNETYHHWRIFSHGADGVCIEFDKPKLLTAFEGDPNIRAGRVKYVQVKTIRKRKTIDKEKLPFLKRYPYRHEVEFRVVYVDAVQALEFKDYPVKTEWIRRVTLSPWMSKALATSVKETLQAIPGCSQLKVARSTLVDNEEWKRATARVR